MVRPDPQIVGFLRASLSRPFAWGRDDCALWAASCAHHVTGRDPAAHLRGTYHSAFQCRRIVLRAGGLVTLCRQLMRDFEAGERVNGIAVGRVEGSTVAGVLSAGRFIVKTPDGQRAPDMFTIIEGWSL